MLQFNSLSTGLAQQRREDQIAHRCCFCSQMLFLERYLTPTRSPPRSQLSPTLPSGLVFGEIWRFSSEGAVLGKMSDQTALYLKVYQLSIQTVQSHSWMCPGGSHDGEVLWSRASIGFSYNTLTKSWLLSSLLYLTLHLYYFIKVLSSIILIFYRSEA